MDRHLEGGAGVMDGVEEGEPQGDGAGELLRLAPRDLAPLLQQSWAWLVRNINIYYIITLSLSLSYLQSSARLTKLLINKVIRCFVTMSSRNNKPHPFIIPLGVSSL